MRRHWWPRFGRASCVPWSPPGPASSSPSPTMPRCSGESTLSSRRSMTEQRSSSSGAGSPRRRQTDSFPTQSTSPARGGSTRNCSQSRQVIRALMIFWMSGCRGSCGARTFQSVGSIHWPIRGSMNWHSAMVSFRSPMPRCHCRCATPTSRSGRSHPRSSGGRRSIRAHHGSFPPRQARCRACGRRTIPASVRWPGKGRRLWRCVPTMDESAASDISRRVYPSTTSCGTPTRTLYSDSSPETPSSHPTRSPMTTPPPSSRGSQQLEMMARPPSSRRSARSTPSSKTRFRPPRTSSLGSPTAAPRPVFLLRCGGRRNSNR